MITYADSTEVEYSYDALRRLKEVRDSLGITIIERDKLGRETKIIDYKGREVSYSYDRLGNRTGICYANGKTVNYVYENNKIKDIVFGDSKTELIYNAFGRLVSRKTGLYETVYAYNKSGLLESLISTKGDEILDSFKYAYNANGDLILSEQTRKDATADSGVFSYEYDELNRLTSVGKDGTKLRTYSYDAIGNRLSKTEQGKTKKYLYNEANQLISATDGELETKFAYDKRGNITQKTTGNKVSTFRYNAANRLVSATNSDGLSSRYAYNGLGFRVSKTSGNSSIDYILDQTMMYNNLLEEVSNNQSNDYIWHEDTLISKSNIPIYSDRLNTPIRIGDKAYSYDEFGVSLHGVDGMGFIGYMHDDISGTYFAQAREYLPEIGRFAGRDILKGEVEIPRSLNEYVYCHNNPIGFVDYDGMKAKTADDYIAAGVDGAAREVVDKVIVDKAANSITKKAFAKKVAFNRTKRRYTKSCVRYGKAVDKAAASKIKATKVGAGIATVAIDVGVGYVEDKKAGKSASKKRSNALVNLGYSAAGLFLTDAAVSGAVAMGVISGPVGWGALAIAVVVGVGVSVVKAATEDDIKNAFNSLE